MPGGNGHGGNGHGGNGHDPSREAAGATGAADLIEERHNGRKRASLQVIQQAVENGWAIPQEWRSQLPKIAAQIAGDPANSKRDRLRAMEVLKAFDVMRLDAAGMLDKIERLDKGTHTDIVGFQPVTIRRVSRITDVDE